MKVFVTSDTHFGHNNIIRYCNRPFRDTDEMDSVLIKNWNETVGKNDVVFHLGDVSFHSREKTKEIVSQLNGKKILIMGNHDCYKEDFYEEAGFHTVSRFPILYNDFFLMSHAPLVLSNTTPYFNCYGHVHNDDKYVDSLTSKCFCVERTNYRPSLLFEK